VVRNKPTIAMSSLCVVPRVLLREAPDYIGSHRIKHAYNFYFVLLVSSRLGYWCLVDCNRLNPSYVMTV